MFGSGLRRWSSSQGQEADRKVTTRSIYRRGSLGNPSDSGKHGRTHQTGTHCRSLCRGRVHTISTVEAMKHLCLMCALELQRLVEGKNMYHQLFLKFYCFNHLLGKMSNTCCLNVSISGFSLSFITVHGEGSLSSGLLVRQKKKFEHDILGS